MTAPGTGRRSNGNDSLGSDALRLEEKPLNLLSSEAVAAPSTPPKLTESSYFTQPQLLQRCISQNKTEVSGIRSGQERGQTRMKVYRRRRGADTDERESTRLGATRRGRDRRTAPLRHL